MVAAAFNFDSVATEPASCVAVLPGCMDTASSAFEPAANVAADGECVYARPGCRAPSASNFDSLATEDDGSCVIKSPPPLPPPVPSAVSAIKLAENVDCLPKRDDEIFIDFS